MIEFAIKPVKIGQNRLFKSERGRRAQISRWWHIQSTSQATARKGERTPRRRHENHQTELVFGHSGQAA